MVSNSVEIGNICDLQEGYVNPSQKVPGYFGGGIRWLRAVDLNDAEVFETSRTLSQAGYESAGKSALMFPANSIGISKSGTIGRLGILRKPMCGNRAVINIVPKQSNDLRYIFYSLRMARQSIIAMAVGSVQKNLYVPVLESLTIPWPEQHVRDTIVDIAGSIDDKIAVNTRVNDYLATLVDLEFSKRFSGSVSTTSLKNVLEISTKSLKPQQHAGETWEHYSIPAFDEMHWPIFELADGIKSNKYIVDRSSILISKLNPSIKRMWIPACLTDKAVCSTEFIVYKPLEPRHKSFYCAAINAASFTAFLLEHVTGSTGSRQRAQPKATLDYPMPSPCRTAIEAFCDFADPIYRQIELNGIESQRLGSLRDALLPKLMSGEIDVSKVGLMQPNNHLYVQ